MKEREYKNLNSTPLISIVTACLNRKDFIIHAINSVLDQNFSNYEHIIIDGGSTDGTLELLTNYPHLKVISEPDCGVYDAFNKGIALAKGEYITFLNSDDIWPNNSIKSFISKFDQFPDSDIYAGDAVVCKKEEDGGLSRLASLPALSTKGCIENLTKRGPVINAWFFKHAVFEKIGLFRSDYKISGDFELLLRVIINNIMIYPINHEIYYYIQHEESLTFSSNYKSITLGRREKLSIINDYLKLDVNDEFKKQLIVIYKKIIQNQIKFTYRKMIQIVKKFINY